jgi:hypothetical protein
MARGGAVKAKKMMGGGMARKGMMSKGTKSMARGGAVKRRK